MVGGEVVPATVHPGLRTLFLAGVFVMSLLQAPAQLPFGTPDPPAISTS